MVKITINADSGDNPKPQNIQGKGAANDMGPYLTIFTIRFEDRDRSFLCKRSKDRSSKNSIFFPTLLTMWLLSKMSHLSNVIFVGVLQLVASNHIRNTSLFKQPQITIMTIKVIYLSKWETPIACGRFFIVAVFPNFRNLLKSFIYPNLTPITYCGRFRFCGLLENLILVAPKFAARPSLSAACSSYIHGGSSLYPRVSPSFLSLPLSLFICWTLRSKDEINW